MATVFRDRDKGAKALLTALKTPRRKIVVGILDGGVPHPGSTMTVGDIATVHEFGSSDGRVPERSFLRGWYDEKLDENRALLGLMVKSIKTGQRTAEQVLTSLGLLFVGQIQRRIAQGIPPPLKPATIDRKGSSTPLIDTGFLRKHITFEVR